MAEIPSASALIYDWNTAGNGYPLRAGTIEFDDETLRDGLQSPSVTDPKIEDKLRILHYMNDIGIDNADIGLPGAGPHVQKTVERLAREIVDQKLSVYPSAAGRTHDRRADRRTQRNRVTAVKHLSSPEGQEALRRLAAARTLFVKIALLRPCGTSLFIAIASSTESIGMT